MRKRSLGSNLPQRSFPEADWLGLETCAAAEVSSEDPAFPLESALGLSQGPGWRAADAGTQTIRFLFDRPVPVRRIYLEFVEEQRERTHEFVLLWSDDGAETFREILRQQFNFSSAATREVEDYRLELEGVTALELQIVPDLRHREARASLCRLQIA